MVTLHIVVYVLLKLFVFLLRVLLLGSDDSAVSVLKITSHNDVIIIQMHESFALVPAVLRAAPSEADLGAALFIIGKVVKNQPLLTSGCHEYVH